MDMNDQETVALIGGGHAFGKAHGACMVSPGDPPSLNPTHSWANRCPNGGIVTSGFEGPWSNTPFKWSNAYFSNLMGMDWEKWIGPGGHYQWRVASNPTGPLMMLTSDIALKTDSIYRQWSNFYANGTNMMTFTSDFMVRSQLLLFQ
jgi:catalase (peroxidase I)